MTQPTFPPIGERLREARRERGLTVRGLARAVDVSPSLISQIETGKGSPSVSTLYAITAALEISIEDLFGQGDRPRARRGGAGAPKVAALVPPDRASVRGRAPGPAAMNGGREATAADVTAVDVTAVDVAAVEVAAVEVAAVEVAAVEVTAVEVAAVEMARSATAATSANSSSVDRSATSATTQGLRMLHQKRRVGPVVRPADRETLHLDSGVTWELLGQLPDMHVDFIRITYAPGGSSSGAGVLMRHSGTEWGHVLSGQLTLTLAFDTYVLGPGDSVSFDCSTPHAYANHGTEPAVGIWFVAERFR